MLLSVIVSAFVRREGDVQFATGLLLLVSIFSLGVHTFYMPYATASNNALEMLSLLGIIGVLFSFIMYLAAAILGEQGIAIATFQSGRQLTSTHATPALCTAVFATCRTTSRAAPMRLPWHT